MRCIYFNPAYTYLATHPKFLFLTSWSCTPYCTVLLVRVCIESLLVTSILSFKGEELRWRWIGIWMSPHSLLDCVLDQISKPSVHCKFLLMADEEYRK